MTPEQGKVKGVTTEEPLESGKKDLSLYILSGLAIVIAGYLVFNHFRKKKI